MPKTKPVKRGRPVGSTKNNPLVLRSVRFEPQQIARLKKIASKNSALGDFSWFLRFALDLGLRELERSQVLPLLNQSAKAGIIAIVD